MTTHSARWSQRVSSSEQRENVIQQEMRREMAEVKKTSDSKHGTRRRYTAQFLRLTDMEDNVRCFSCLSALVTSKKEDKLTTNNPDVTPQSCLPPYAVIT